MRPERTKNLVLQQLAAADPAVFARLFDELEPVVLERGAVLGARRSQAESSYFIESGVVSMVGSISNGSSVEVGIVGREGMAGIADALGHAPLPYRLVVQLPGLAYRVPSAVIREHILSCTTLHGLLMDYSQRMMHQLAQSAVCNRFHTSVQRLSRWLLLTAERAETNRFELTHEFVSQMVGSPRSAVSESAGTLREKGIIDYRRGVLTIRNPARLRKIACECFDAISQPFEPSSAQPSSPKSPAAKTAGAPRSRSRGKA